MAALGKVKAVTLDALIRNDWCRCRPDAERPERKGKNKIWLWFNHGMTCSDALDWNASYDIIPVVHSQIDDRLETCKKMLKRGNIVIAGSLQCTFPKDLKSGDEEKFCEAFRLFCEAKFGAENMLAVCEHYHEWSDHLQAYFIPVVMDKKINQYKVSGKEFFNHSLYLTLHPELNDFIDKKLGYHVSIELDENNPDKHKGMGLNQYKLAKKNEEIRKLKKSLQKERTRGNYFLKVAGKGNAVLDVLSRSRNSLMSEVYASVSDEDIASAEQLLESRFELYHNSKVENGRKRADKARQRV